MKDEFLRFAFNRYVALFRATQKLTYAVIDRKRAKNCPELPSAVKKSILRYWKKYGVKPKLYDYQMFASRGIDPDPRIISTDIWTSVIEPNRNNIKYSEAFSDKNYFDLVLSKENTLDTIVRCISGQFLDANYSPINAESALALIACEEDVIIKPSIDTGGGRGVQKVSASECNQEMIVQATEDYQGNFCIQRVFEQHEFMKAFNPSSIQTIRIISLLIGDRVEIVCATMRIGKQGSVVDNCISGGYATGVDVNTGFIGDRLVDHDKNFYTFAEVGMVQSGECIPNWELVKDLVCNLHPRLSHFGVISWDIAISKQGNPTVVEYNILDAIVDWHEMFLGPLLGERTDEILPILMKKNPYFSY